MPLIERNKDAIITIGKNVTLNSQNKEYHLNLFGKVKLVADRPNAKISIGDKTRIHGSCIHAWGEIIIGKRVLIAGNVNIIDSNGHEIMPENVEQRIYTTGIHKPIVIEDDVWIGAGSMVLPGVTIGRGSVIGAGSIVSRNIPSYSIAAGNPVAIKNLKDKFYGA